MSEVRRRVGVTPAAGVDSARSGYLAEPSDVLSGSVGRVQEVRVANRAFCDFAEGASAGPGGAGRRLVDDGVDREDFWREAEQPAVCAGNQGVGRRAERRRAGRCAEKRGGERGRTRGHSSARVLREDWARALLRGRRPLYESGALPRAGGERSGEARVRLRRFDREHPVLLEVRVLLRRQRAGGGVRA